MPPFDWYDLEFLLKVLSGQILPIQLLSGGIGHFLRRSKAAETQTIQKT